MEPSTYQKILIAAKKVFFQKGYHGTRTRDIAAEAQVNLAMLNYHFKSKEQLFELIMMEALNSFVTIIKDILNDPDTDFETKLTSIITEYINKFSKEPQLPPFVIAQLSKSPDHLFKVLRQSNSFAESVFLQQYQQGVANGMYRPVNMVHLLMNIGGFFVFPFLISPALKGMAALPNEAINGIMEERKILIFNWIKQMIIK